jgi:exonuclease III
MNLIKLEKRLEEVIDLMGRRRVDVLGMSETKRMGTGVEELRGGYKLYWSGNGSEEKNGVGFVVREGMREEVEFVNERIIKLRISMKGNQVEIIQVYAPHTGHMQEDKEEFAEMLEQHMGKENQIVMGDFNAQVGQDRRGFEEVLGADGWGERNLEGERLLELCVRNEMLVGNSWYKKKYDSHKITRYAWGTNRGTVIDYILLTKEVKKKATNIKVIPSESLDSDHRLLVMDMKGWQVKRQQIELERRIKIWILKDDAKKQEYRKLIQEKIPKDEPKEVEEEWRRLREGVMAAAEVVCGRTSGKRRWKETPWWNDRTREAVEKKNKALRKLFKERTPETEREYKDRKKDAKLIVGAEKRKWAEKWTKMLEEDVAGSKKVLYGLVRNKRKDKGENVRLMDDTGKIVDDGKTVLNLWKCHFEELLNPDKGQVEEEDIQAGQCEEARDVEDLRWGEVEEALKRMKPGKAPGVDELPIELVKEAGVVGVQWLYRVMKVVWRERRVPKEWTKGVIIPIFKKGDRKQCKNYRGITLMCHCAKVYEKILERRIRNKVEQEMREEQYGFRSGRSTVDLIFAIRQLQERFYEHGKDLVMAFMDIEKAYDSVGRKEVWRALSEKGVEDGLVERVRSTYVESESCVKTALGRTKGFKIRSGLKQGSALSPLLFIITMDRVTWEVAEKLGEQKMKAMLFADDLMIWGENERMVQEQLDLWSSTVEKYGLKFKAEKSEVVVMTRKENRTGRNIKLRGEALQVAESFRYLGSTINSKGGIEEEINRRGQQGAGLYNVVRDLIWSRDVPVKCKKVIYNSYYVPVITYGAETWTMKKRDESRVQAMEMKFLRSMVGKTRKDKIRNEAIRERVGVEKLQGRIENSRMRWYGHMKRMDQDRIPRRMHEMEMEGTRPRGRPRRRWLSQIRKGVEDRGQVWERVEREEWWNERARWRGLTSLPTRPLAGNGEG